MSLMGHRTIPYLCLKLMFLFKFSGKRRNPSFQTILRLLTHSVISARSKKQLFFILDILGFGFYFLNSKECNEKLILEYRNTMPVRG